MSQFSSSIYSDDDDLLIPLTQTRYSIQPSISQGPLGCSLSNRSLKKPKRTPIAIGKENIPSLPNWDLGFNTIHTENDGSALNDIEASESPDNGFDCSLDTTQPSTVACSYTVPDEHLRVDEVIRDTRYSSDCDDKKVLKINEGYFCNSIESRLMKLRERSLSDEKGDALEADEDLGKLFNLCSEVEEEENVKVVGCHTEEMGVLGDEGCLVHCPLCGVDLSDLSIQLRQVHTNDCLDKEGNQAEDVVVPNEERAAPFLPEVDKSLHSPVQAVLEWLRNLGLSRYEDVFVREEIDWDTLKWMRDEDLFTMGITALGPRKKILHALRELREGSFHAVDACMVKDSHVLGEHGKQISGSPGSHNNTLEGSVDDSSKLTANKLITDYFPGFAPIRKKATTTSSGQHGIGTNCSDSGRKCIKRKSSVTNGKHRNVPLWCCIPGTPFRVDAFRYLRGDCLHWFLTHFHTDHYQGLTKSFCHGKIYCSSITAKLVHMKIGIPWEKIEVLPLNKKMSIAGIDVTCLDANHCPGSIIILFEPPNGKPVLHTGDFRFCEQMGSLSSLQTCRIHTLILDTTYCNPQYDFPKQEAVIQFVIDAIQAEAFNPKTLFLIGSYTIGKERLFLEVARVLRKKVYVNASKLRILKCLGLPEEDMQLFTLNEMESQIHVVPMWTLASFKRLKHIANQYVGRFSLIVAFSPTGWSFGKGKKTPGRRWQQGTVIRYEVPYSEHSSFTELKEFVKLVSPVNIIPSVNNNGPDSAKAMTSLLLS